MRTGSRRLLPLLVAALAATSLAGCTSPGGTRHGIPQDAATALQAQIQEVQQLVQQGGDGCARIDTQVRQVQERVDNLPSSVSSRLRQRLTEGVQRLRDAAVRECNAQTTETQTQETQTQTTETQDTTTTDTTTGTTTTGTTTTDTTPTDTGTDTSTDTTPPDTGTDTGTDTTPSDGSGGAGAGP